MDWTALRVSLSLGLWTVALLLPAGVWAGHQLATRQFRGKPILEALVAIPLILPPTVLGFYLLTMFSPRSPLGAAFESVIGHTLAFSFPGLVAASAIVNTSPSSCSRSNVRLRRSRSMSARPRPAAACCPGSASFALKAHWRGRGFSRPLS